MLQYDDWSSLLIASVIKTLQELGGSTWGYVIQENWGFVYDLEAAIENMADSSIQVLQRTVDDSGIKISATVGADITELTEVTQLVCNLLTPVGELLLVFLAIYDEEALRYWFVIGTPSHGHIGEIRIERDSIPQIELPKLNQLNEIHYTALIAAFGEGFRFFLFVQLKAAFLDEMFMVEIDERGR